MARPSHVRDAVRARLTAGSRHGWTIEDLQQDLHDAQIPADYSSVFRSLVWLEGEGLAQRVDLGDGKARYEAAGSHHEHVQCEGCGTVRVVPDCIVEDATGEIERSTGFRLQTHRLVLTGLCPACQAGGDRTS
jgi:Fur family transcriptional regulator, ferric uptake regulator